MTKLAGWAARGPCHHLLASDKTCSDIRRGCPFPRNLDPAAACKFWANKRDLGQRGGCSVAAVPPPSTSCPSCSISQMDQTGTSHSSHAAAELQ